MNQVIERSEVACVICVRYMMNRQYYRIRADNATLYYKMIAAHNYFLKGAVITVVTLLFIIR